MKTFRHILSWLQAAVLISLATACHDDLRSPEPIPDVNIDTGISIRIPNLDASATRAESWNVTDPDPNKAPLADEAKINTTVTVDNKELQDFWLLIYSADDSKTGYAYNKAINISGLSSLPTFEEDGTTKKWAGAVKTLITGGTATEVKVPMNPGKYKVYLVANVHKYLDKQLFSKDSDGNYVPVPENDLKNALLTFNADNFGDHILVPGELPMLCQPTDVEEATSGLFDILDQTLTSLHCNMAFLCAKVRYTVLFDNTDFSKNDFGSRLLSFPESDAVSVKTIATNTQLVGSKTPVFNQGSFSTALSEINYPDNPAESLDAGESPSANGKLAWQGIVYLPENNTANSRTKMTFNAEATDADGKNASANPYDITLIDNAKQNGNPASSLLLRGNFYDLCIKATTLKTYDLEFTIKDWDIQQIIYDLHGPYFLEVGNTENVSVESGAPTYIYYDTNAAKLDFKSATYKRGNEEIPIYEFKEVVVDGMRQIRITINGAITAAEGKEITDKTKAGDHSYDYFHVIAGNISKKITVNPLSITTFLDVEPGVININVREQKSSGIYSGAFPVTIKTNYDEYTITAENWEELTSSKQNDSDLMYLAYKDEHGNYQRITFGEKREKPATGTDELYLVYTGLNDENGSEFWSRFDHSFKLTVTAKSEGTESETGTVRINTKRASDNYIIYLRADSWKLPHIYVYQCLSFPMDAAEDRAGKSLATGSDGQTAALEYSFTGKLAFKGWNVGTYNSTDGTLGDSNGFKYFMSPSSSWDPKEDNGEHYFIDYDFCQEYRNSYEKTGEDQHMKCATCYGDDYEKLWPGIAMEEVTLNDNKWWRFELTPVATPGKALIMFADAHASGATAHRYPADKQVGVPLFDYPERTGWFNWTDNQLYFQSSDPFAPEEETESDSYTYRIYWQHHYNNVYREYIYIYGSPDISLNQNCYHRTGNLTTDGGDNMDYYEFKSSCTPSTMNDTWFIAKSVDGTTGNNWAGQTKNLQVVPFVKVNGRYESYNTKLD